MSRFGWLNFDPCRVTPCDVEVRSWARCRTSTRVTPGAVEVRALARALLVCLLVCLLLVCLLPVRLRDVCGHRGLALVSSRVCVCPWILARTLPMYIAGVLPLRFVLHATSCLWKPRSLSPQPCRPPALPQPCRSPALPQSRRPPAS